MLCVFKIEQRLFVEWCDAGREADDDRRSALLWKGVRRGSRLPRPPSSPQLTTAYLQQEALTLAAISYTDLGTIAGSFLYCLNK